MEELAAKGLDVAREPPRKKVREPRAFDPRSTPQAKTGERKSARARVVEYSGDVEGLKALAKHQAEQAGAPLIKAPTSSVDAVNVVSETPPEMVNHPAHYGGRDDPYEAVKVIEAHRFNFNLGSAFKYMARAGRKGPRIVDLQKAHWYISREIETLKGEHEPERVRMHHEFFKDVQRERDQLREQLESAHKTMDEVVRESAELVARVARVEAKVKTSPRAKRSK